MTEINIDEPNKLLDCSVYVFEVEKAHLGILGLETDQGEIQIVINRNMAAMLISELAIFMAAEEVDSDASDDEGPAN